MSEKDPVDLVAESVKLQETALKLQIKNQPTLRDLFAMAALQGLLANPDANLDYGRKTYADVAYDTACENQVAYGEGYIRLLTEYCEDSTFDQDIKIGRIRNSFSVYMDPTIQDPTGADAKYCFITEDITKLAATQRAIGNFVNIVTGKQIPVAVYT